MSLEDRFNEILAPRSRCVTCLWYEQLDAKDKAFFDGKSADNMKKLWRACRTNGLDIGYASFVDHIQNHIRGSSG
jgi:hypothetical protein